MKIKLSIYICFDIFYLESFYALDQVGSIFDEHFVRGKCIMLDQTAWERQGCFSSMPPGLICSEADDRFTVGTCTQTTHTTPIYKAYVRIYMTATKATVKHTEPSHEHRHYQEPHPPLHSGGQDSKPADEKIHTHPLIFWLFPNSHFLSVLLCRHADELLFHDLMHLTENIHVQHIR